MKTPERSLHSRISLNPEPLNRERLPSRSVTDMKHLTLAGYSTSYFFYVYGYVPANVTKGMFGWWKLGPFTH